MVQEHPFARVQIHAAVTQTDTKNKKKRKRERNPFLKQKNSGFIKQAKDMVHTLLYSNTRSILNEQKIQDVKKRIKRKLKQYIKSCKEDGKKSHKEKGHHIMQREMSTLRLSPLDVEQPKRIKVYVEKIIKLWNIMGTTPYGIKNKSHIHFQDHVIGTLYLMQYGYSFDSHVILSKDSYLWKMLPPVHDLKHYGVPKKSLTIGKNHLCYSLKSAYNNDTLPFSDINHINTLWNLDHPTKRAKK